MAQVKESLLAQLEESARMCVTEICQKRSILREEWTESDRRELDEKMQRLLEKILERVRPEFLALPDTCLGYPIRAIEAYLQIFGNHFKACVLEEHSGDENFRSIAEDSTTEAQEYLRLIVEADSSIRTAIAAGDFRKAERIARGQMELHPGDVGWLNHLFNVGCFSGNACLIVEVRRKTKTGEFLLAPKMVSRDAVNCFLSKAVVVNICAQSNPLLQSGLLVSLGLSHSQKKEVIETVHAIGDQVTEEVIAKFAERQNWTTKGFLAMCRQAVVDKCRIYEKWIPGTKFTPQWVGESVTDALARASRS